EHPRQIVEFLLDQLEELEHHPRAALRVGGGPSGLGGLGIGDGGFGVGLVCQRDLSLHLAGIGVEYVAETAGRALGLLAADKMTDFTHGSGSSVRRAVFRAVLDDDRSALFHRRLAFTAD